MPFLRTGSPKSLRNKVEPPLTLIISDNEFELIAVGTKDGSSKGEPRWLVRHGGKFQGFWLIEKSTKFAKKTEGSPTDNLETLIRGYWTIAIYQISRNVELIDLKWKFLSTLTGQGIFICGHHTIPLTRDFRKSGSNVDVVVHRFCAARICNATLAFASVTSMKVYSSNTDVF